MVESNARLAFYEDKLESAPVVTRFGSLTLSRSSTMCQTSKNTTTQLKIVLAEAAIILDFITLGSSRVRFWYALALEPLDFVGFPSLVCLER